MNRDELLSSFSVKSELVRVCGKDIRLKEMSGADRDEYFTKLARAEKIKTVIDGEEIEVPNVSGMKGYLISRLVVDDNLNPLLNEEDAGALSVEFTDEVFNKISELNKLSDADVDEAEKN